MAGRLDQGLVDDFVGLAHDEPSAAATWLRRRPELAPLTSSWGENALHAASHLGHRQLLSALLDHGAVVDLYTACSMGDTAKVRALLPAHSAPACGIHGLPLLHFGVVSRDVQMLEFLLGAGVAANQPGASLSPLHSAVAIGSKAMIRLLLAAGADTRFRDALGATALDWAQDLDAFDEEVLDLLDWNTSSVAVEEPRYSSGWLGGHKGGRHRRYLS
jgi:ankyrin repeat protein